MPAATAVATGSAVVRLVPAHPGEPVNRIYTLLLDAMDDFDLARLSDITMPTALICGIEDEDNGSAPRLAEALPSATYAPIPGTHMSSVTKPEFGERLAAFVGEP